MVTAPDTRPSLLARLRDAADDAAWRQFVQLYAPLVYRFARARGLQDADAADLTQEVLQSVAAASRRLEYDPGRGTFRSWLFTVARNRLNNFLLGRHRRDRRLAIDAPPLDELPARGEESALWQREYEQRLFDWAAELVRERFQAATWQAFWQTAVENRSVGEVAAALGMSVGAVYIARSRVLTRLREQVRVVEDGDGLPTR